MVGCVGVAGGGGKFARPTEPEPTPDPVTFEADACDELPEVKRAACRTASGTSEPDVTPELAIEHAPPGEDPEGPAVEAPPSPPPRCAWVLFDEEGFAIAEGEARVAIVEGRVSFVDLPKPTAYDPELFLCRIDGAVVSLEGLTIASKREVR